MGPYLSQHADITIGSSMAVKTIQKEVKGKCGICKRLHFAGWSIIPDFGVPWSKSNIHLMKEM